MCAADDIRPRVSCSRGSALAATPGDLAPRLPLLEPGKTHEMLSHLKSRNGYGVTDINLREEEESKTGNRCDAGAVTAADESSEAAESSVNSEIEDIEETAGDPAPGSDGSTYSEEESEDSREVGEKRKRGESESKDVEDIVEEDPGTERMAKRRSKGRGWSWLLEEDKDESDHSDYAPGVEELEEAEEVDKLNSDPDFGKTRGGPGKGRRGRGRGTRPPKSNTIEKMLEEMDGELFTF